MTSEEAITTLELAISEVEWNYPLDISIALETAIEALKKQIPRRAILDTSFPTGVKWWRCPVCAQNNIETNDRFCYRCGQALDWGEDEC